MEKPIFGGHVSAAGGLVNAVANAQKIGARTIQIFGASPRQFAVKMPSADSIAAYKAAIAKSGIGSVYLHAAYLVRLGSEKESLRAISIKNLAGHLKIAEMIGARGLVFHLGSQGEGSKENAIKKTVAGMHAVLKSVPGKALLIMENSSGGGTKLGATVDDLAALFKKAKTSRVKLCFDTAHAFEAGVLRYEKPADIKKFFDEWDRKIGLPNLEAVHANDSKTAFATGADRHENIGRGFIGLQGFKNLALEKRLWSKPWILEVPGFADEGPDKKNIEALRTCFSG